MDNCKIKLYKLVASSTNMYLHSVWFLIFLSVTFAKGRNKVVKPDFQAMNFAKEIRGRKLNGSLIKEKEVDSENSCQLECVHERQCLSYNFGLLEDNKTFICQLSHSDRFSGVKNFTKDEKVLYRGIKVITF